MKTMNLSKLMLILVVIIFCVICFFGMIGVGLIKSLDWNGFISYVSSNPWVGVPMVVGLIPMSLLLPLFLITPFFIISSIRSAVNKSRGGNR
jgi:hypothetical protein